MKKVCIIGASGKLGQYMVQHALDRGYEVVGVCRERSVGKLDAFKERITVIPGATNDHNIIKRAVEGCDGVLTVLVPWGVNHYSSGTAQAVLDYARLDARLIFSCGWHITRDSQDVYSKTFKLALKATSWFGRIVRAIDIKHVDECFPATPGGLSCVVVTLKKVRVRDYQYGAITSATPSSKATSHAA